MIHSQSRKGGKRVIVMMMSSVWQTNAIRLCVSKGERANARVFVFDTCRHTRMGMRPLLGRLCYRAMENRGNRGRLSITSRLIEANRRMAIGNLPVPHCRCRSTRQSIRDSQLQSSEQRPNGEMENETIECRMAHSQN